MADLYGSNFSKAVDVALELLLTPSASSLGDLDKQDVATLTEWLQDELIDDANFKTAVFAIRWRDVERLGLWSIRPWSAELWQDRLANLRSLGFHDWYSDQWEQSVKAMDATNLKEI
jgi:hypothetical protein